MLKKIECKSCGQINIVNITKTSLGKQTDIYVNELLGSESVEFIETEMDIKECKGCGELLTIE